MIKNNEPKTAQLAQTIPNLRLCFIKRANFRTSFRRTLDVASSHISYLVDSASGITYILVLLCATSA